MSSFQSAPLPLVTRLFANPILHITVISFLVVAGTLYIVRQQQKQEIARRMEYLRGGPVFADVQKQKSPSAAQESSASTAAQADPAADLPPPPPAPDAAAVAANAASSSQGFLAGNRNMAAVDPQNPSARGAAGTRATTGREVKMKVHYVLAANAVVGRLLQEAQTQPNFVDFGDVRMGSVKTASVPSSGLDTLESLEKTAESEGPELMWHVGEKSETGVGITSKVQIMSRDNQAIRGEIEILKAFYENQERGNGPSLKPFGPAQFEVVPKSSLILTMRLPTVPQSDAATGFMRLFQMTNFMNNQSQFMIIIDFE